MANEFDTLIKDIDTEITNLKNAYQKTSLQFKTIQYVRDADVIPTSANSRSEWSATYPEDRICMLSAGLDLQNNDAQHKPCWMVTTRIDLENHKYTIWIDLIGVPQSDWGKTFTVPLVIVSTSEVVVKKESWT